MTTPTEIQYHQKSRVLELHWGEQVFELGCELLRVYSPSAEVRGHGPGREVLQTGKKNVAISDIRPVGNYALQLIFDDGHDSGIYSWDYLFQLGREQQQRWDEYLARLHDAGASRDPDVQVVQFDP